MHVQRTGHHVQQANADQNEGCADGAHEQVLVSRRQCAPLFAEGDERVGGQRRYLHEHEQIEDVAGDGNTQQAGQAQAELPPPRNDHLAEPFARDGRDPVQERINVSRRQDRVEIVRGSGDLGAQVVGGAFEIVALVRLAQGRLDEAVTEASRVALAPGEIDPGYRKTALLIVGLLVGSYLNWLFVAGPLRRESARLGALTISGYFEKRFPSRTRSLRLVTAIVILAFFLIYTAAGLVAGGIKVALITTATGLAIAIPINIAHNYFVSRVDRIVIDMEDEIIRGATVIKDGEITWPPPAPKMSSRCTMATGLIISNAGTPSATDRARARATAQ